MKANHIFLGTGASAPKHFDELLGIVRTALDSGIFYFDTAPSYKTEKVLGDALHVCMNEMGIDREKLFIQTKIDAWQMQDGNVRGFIDSVLSDMQLDYLDALLVHWPVPEYMDDTWEKIVAAKNEGKVKHIGVCNVRIRQLQEYIRYDVKPEIVQIERNPLRTCEEEIEFCHNHGLEVQSYSPLCKMNHKLRDSQILKDIAESKGKSLGQVILRWHLDTGVTPIFTSTKPSRIKEYSGIYDFSLDTSEINAISSLNEDYKMYLESWACPGF